MRNSMLFMPHHREERTKIKKELREREGKCERKILEWKKGYDKNENLSVREWHYTWQVPEVLGDWISKLDGKERANYWN